ncbi:hypothetical protein [Carnobacterium sp. TMP28]
MYDDGEYPTYVFEKDKTFIELANPETGKDLTTLNVFGMIQIY